MRYSIIPNDTAFSEENFFIDVYRNGVLLDDCLTVDTDEGYAEVYQRNIAGGFVIDHDNKILKTKRIYGDFTVVKQERE